MRRSGGSSRSLPWRYALSETGDADPRNTIVCNAEGATRFFAALDGRRAEHAPHSNFLTDNARSSVKIPCTKQRIKRRAPEIVEVIKRRKHNMEETCSRAAAQAALSSYQQHARLEGVLRRLDVMIASSEAEAAALPAAAEEAASTSQSQTPIAVVIGTSAMAESDPNLVGAITTMINGSYFDALRELLPPSATTYNRVSEEDVQDRLEMGDAGARANRVLHLAFRGEGDERKLVGCCSSTFQPPWTPEGCGHWGLLVAHTDAKGTGVASALVAAAERRLAGACHMVQIEYDYTPGHAYSEKLMEVYETRYGFECTRPRPRASRRGSAAGGEDNNGGASSFGESQFRKCFKKLPDRLVTEMRPQHLKGIRAAFAAQLTEVDGGGGGGEQEAERAAVMAAVVQLLFILLARRCGCVASARTRRTMGARCGCSSVRRACIRWRSRRRSRMTRRRKRRTRRTRRRRRRRCGWRRSCASTEVIYSRPNRLRPPPRWRRSPRK